VSSSFVRVARVDELPEAVASPVRVDGRDLALVRFGGTVYAIRNRCPHMTIAFEGAPAIERATGTVDEVEWEPDPVIVCRWHQFEFSLLRGECLTNRSLRFATYEVDVRDGEVFVDPTPRRLRASA
jgi:nitrite reductase/ring-hydroxylating ferredoxin subunit